MIDRILIGVAGALHDFAVWLCGVVKRRRGA